jgi:hypothetical protein
MNQVLGGTPEVDLVIKDRPGKGKTGRVNTSEPSMRLRHSSAAEKMTDTAVWANGTRLLGQTWRVNPTWSWIDKDTQPRSKDGTHPSRISSMRNVITPMESGGGRYAGKPEVTMAELSSGDGMTQEAKAGSRKTTGIHNRPDRAIPNPKGC